MMSLISRYHDYDSWQSLISALESKIDSNNPFYLMLCDLKALIKHLGEQKEWNSNEVYDEDEYISLTETLETRFYTSFFISFLKYKNS